MGRGKGENAKLGVRGREGPNSSVLAGSLLSDLGNSIWVSVWTQLMFIKYLLHFHLILTMSPQRKNYYVHFANRETETQRDKPNVSKPLCAKVTCPGFNSGTSRSQ